MKWFGVLIWYWINRNIGLSSIGVNEMYYIYTNEGDSGMLLDIYGKLTMAKLKSFRL
jgi:hypothetical protein